MPLTKQAVSAIITNVYDEVLLVKRKDSEDFMPSAWELPGGGVEDGESIGAALRREVLEETGLTIRIYYLVGHCTYGDTLQHNFDVPLTAGRPPITLTEHSEYAWVGIDTLGEYLPPGDMILGVLLKWGGPST